MRFPNKIISLVLIVFTSCQQSNYHYPKNPSITNEKGIPKDSLAFYFSSFEPLDSSQLEFVRDTFLQNYLSTNLYAFREPILYNDYLGKEQYRFLWLRSFHLPMVFTICNNNGTITLTTKKLGRQPLFRDRQYVEIPEWDSEYVARGYTVIKQPDKDERGNPEVVTIVKADRRTNIVYDSTIKLTENDWQHFLNLLNSARFWDVKPYYREGTTDGAVWLFEANTKHRYKFVIRQLPEGKIRDIGELLIKLSGLKEEIY